MGIMTQREFDIGTILSVMTGRLVSPDSMGGVHALCDHLAGEALMTHQLTRVVWEAESWLREQFPDLAGIGIPDDFGGSMEAVLAWLDGIAAEYGQTRMVRPLPLGDHTRIDPIAELRMMRPDAEIIAVALPEGDAP